MPTIIRDLPYSDQETIVTVRGREYPVFSYQIVLWVSVTPQPVETFDTNTPRFPAVFDTGFTDSFLIGDDQLRQWTGLRPEHLTHVGHFRAHGERVPVHAANVWVHDKPTGQAARTRQTFNAAEDLPHRKPAARPCRLEALVGRRWSCL